MAKLDPKSLLAGISGRIGDLVFCTGRNGTIVKAAPKRGGQKKVSSVQQQEMRVRFKMATQFVRGAGIVMRFCCTHEGNSENSLLIKNLMNHAICGELPNLYIDYRKLMLSTGKLAKPAGGKVVVNNGRKILLSWTSRKRIKSCELVLAVYSILNNCWEVMTTPLEDKYQQMWEVPEFLGELLECFLFVRNRDGSGVSDSVYLGNCEL